MSPAPVSATVPTEEQRRKGEELAKWFADQPHWLADQIAQALADQQAEAEVRTEGRLAEQRRIIGVLQDDCEAYRARIAELKAELEAAKEKAWMYDELCK